MKNKILLFAAMVLIASCREQGTSEEPMADKWNGYGKYLKVGEQVHTLWAGKHLNIGTVTYGIDENANFYVTYDCSASGWKISETHMFAGDKKNMPMNRPGQPKIGRFPYAACHCPKVSIFTYRVPLTQLPPCEEPGFVVAAHAIVHKGCGRTETAWAEGKYKFCDKTWGWYDDYYYNTPPNQSVILYGTRMTMDTLKLYMIDVLKSTSELILSEYVGNTGGSYDGAAFDLESKNFFFANYNTGELRVTQLNGEEDSFSAGILGGISASGTFYNNAYYYVDEQLNTINKVIFTSDWVISAEFVLDTIPGTIVVNDIAMSPDGVKLYLLGHYNAGGSELITWDVSSQEYFTTSIALNENAQIAFGSDDELYAIAPVSDDGGSNVYMVEVETATLYPLDEEVIIIADGVLTDLAGGPGM
jgi:hypothetical protein